jgi:hypothetical protein
MRRVAVLLLLPVLAVALATPAVARNPSGTRPASSSSIVRVAPRITVQRVEQGALDIDAAPSDAGSTKVTVDYEVANGSVIQSTVCLGQFEAASGSSVWGCGTVPLSALRIGRRVARVTLQPVAIPIERCGAAGCVAATATISASLTSVRGTYSTGGDRTQTRTRTCSVITDSSWENADLVGTLRVDGTSYPVESKALADSGAAFPAVSRAPTTTRTICR